MDSIRTLLDCYDGKTFDLCYEILENFGDNADLFEFACKHFDQRKNEKTVTIGQHFSNDEIEEYTSLYSDIVDGLLSTTIKKCNAGLINSKQFYISLWASVCSNFSDLKEKAFAFYYILIDKTIPYQYIGKPLSMSNERYKELIDQNEASIEKVKYIVHSNYSQHTERASLLLTCLDEIADYESKVVVLAQAIKYFNKVRIGESSSGSPAGIDELLRQIDKRIQELESEE